MPFSFPSSPSIGDKSTQNSREYEWSGYAWEIVATPASLNASVITAGTLDAARIANDSITYAKLQNVSATDRLLGRSSAGSGDVEEITCTAFGRSLIDDADAAAARTTLAAAEVNHTHSASDVYVPDNYANFGGADLESVLETIDGALFSGAPTASPAFTGAATVTNDGNVVPLTVTNTGTANSFVVNDASGDTSPFVIDASGNVGIGTSSPACILDLRVANTGSLGPQVNLWNTGTFNNTNSCRIGFATDAGGSTTTPNAAVDAVQVVGAGGGTELRFLTWNGSSLGTRVTVGHTGQLLVTAGSGSSGSYKPGIAVSGDDDTGLQQVGGANTISLVTAGSERVRVGSGGRVAFHANSEKYGVQLNNGSTANGPFIGSDGADILTISTSGGAERMRVKATGSVRFVPLSADPSTGNEAGDVYYNSSTNKLRVYNGTTWVDLH